MDGSDLPVLDLGEIKVDQFLIGVEVIGDD
jgi:hypothetical protein